MYASFGQNVLEESICSIVFAYAQLKDDASVFNSPGTPFHQMQGSYSIVKKYER